MIRYAAILAIVPLLLAAAPAEQVTADPRDKGPDSIDVSSWPPEQQKRYPLFQMKCAKCHPLARAVNAKFDAAGWKRYAKRMIRRPNSGINEEQGAELYQFLSYYAQHGGAK